MFCIYDPVNKEYRAYSWPKKDIIFKDGKLFKVFTGRDLVTLFKEKIIEVFRKLGQRSYDVRC